MAKFIDDTGAARYDGYNSRVEDFRAREYPMLQSKYSLYTREFAAMLTIKPDTTYLDHAGTTLYARSLVERFSKDMISNLYANPHSTTLASQQTSMRIESARSRLLKYLHASPEEYDVVFVANATAGIKMVMDAFRDTDTGYWFGYHKDSHTSVVGMRELARDHKCFASDKEVEVLLEENQELDVDMPRIFAYPAQSNMNGRRLPLQWCQQLRAMESMYSLLDASAYVSTSPLDLDEIAPDFTVLSLYKLFGFPDLGALIVRRASSKILQARKYFGGGTVDMVVCVQEQWHVKKSESLHVQLEDGTLPIHNIMALHAAFDVHEELYGSLQQISMHCAYLAQRLFEGLSKLRHANGLSVCELYQEPSANHADQYTQGPIVAFNIRNAQGVWTATEEVDKLASMHNIQLRTGGLCNPAGMALSLRLDSWELKRNFLAGARCGTGDIVHGKPTGMIRLSLGAMSSIQDVGSFLAFMTQFFVEQHIQILTPPLSPMHDKDLWRVESLMVYPIKSCAGYRIPHAISWQIHPEGLAWDREWCLIHAGTGAALSQKRYPRMALIRPTINIERGTMSVHYADRDADLRPVHIPLSDDPALFMSATRCSTKSTQVCGDRIAARVYDSPAITQFFTQALGVACQLARFPAGETSGSSRHTKAHLQTFQQRETDKYNRDVFPHKSDALNRPILLSNESPILMISRISLNRLNEQIMDNGGKAVLAEAFRANIVVEACHESVLHYQEPYVEDHWRFMAIGRQMFKLLGSCRRCQMVCIDQETAARSSEPFSTLAKTRRFDGKVYFGQHMCHISVRDDLSSESQAPVIRVGDAVNAFFEAAEVNNLGA